MVGQASATLRTRRVLGRWYCRNQYFLQRLRTVDEGLCLRFSVHLDCGEDGDYDAAAMLLLTEGLQCDKRIEVVADLVTGCWRVRCNVVKGLRERGVQQVLTQR